MTAEEFIDALKRENLLPDAMIEKLRKKTQTSSKPLTAKSLARFLIEKGHLTKHQAMTALASGGEVAPPPPEPETPPEPSDVKMPLDDLQDLSSSAEWSIEESGGFADPGVAETVAAETGDAKKKKKKKSNKKSNEWDSPLLLIGGSSLVVLLLVIGAIAFIMTYEDADKRLADAQAALKDGNFPTAIENYEKFIEKHTSHPKYSTARVELAMARIHNKIDRGAEGAFDTAEAELAAIANENDYHVAEDHLADLLPNIARQLADRAEASTDPEKTAVLFEKSKKALSLAYITKNIPKARRDNTSLEGIRATLDRIERRQQSMVDLKATLETINSAVASGDTNGAFKAQEELVDKHPSLIGNKQLEDALAKISEAEQKSISFVTESISANDTDPESPVLATLAKANVLQPGNSPLDGVYCVQVTGVAYGVNATNGEVVWRRYLGPTLDQVFPQQVGNDLLLVEWSSGGDGAKQSLLRVEQTTGKLVWRLPLDDTCSEPVVHGDKIYLSGKSGKLHVVDAASGAQTGFLQFSQPLSSSPAVNATKGVMYVAGERSSLYTISLTDHSCLGVYYSNHARGAIRAAGGVVLDKVVFVENDGAQTCHLKLYGVDGSGAIDKTIGTARLEGQVVRQPLTNGRRLVVLTDRGQISVYEINAGDQGEALSELAVRAATPSSPFVRFGAVQDSNIWYAENSLTKFAVAPSGKRLSVQELSEDYNRSQFVAPLEIRDGVVLHVRSQRGRTGYTVTAADSNTGEAFWQTEVAAPPAGQPVSLKGEASILESDANGSLFRFASNSQTSFNNHSIAGRAEKGDMPIFRYSAQLPGGSALFSSPGSAEALLYVEGNDQGLQLTLPAALSSRPVAFGQGWLAPLVVGQVYYFDAKTGQPLAAPFQPPLLPGKHIDWLPLSVVDEQQFVISDGANKIYLVELRDSGAPALEPIAEAAVSDSPVVTRLAILGTNVVAGTEDGKLLQLSLPRLEPAEPMDIGSPIVWGPYAGGNQVVMATADGKMLAVGAQGKTWEVDTPVTHFAGPPFVSGGELVIASQSGAIVAVDVTTGAETLRLSVGQPLASGPVAMGSGVVVAGRDGALLFVATPKNFTEAS